MTIMMNHEEDDERGNDEENNFDDNSNYRRGLDDENHERRDSISSSSSSETGSIDEFLSTASSPTTSSKSTQITISHRKDRQQIVQQQQQQHHANNNADDSNRRPSHMFRGSVVSGNDSLTDVLRGALDVDNMSFLSEDGTNTCASEGSELGHSRAVLLLESYQRRKMMESAYQKNQSIDEEEEFDDEENDNKKRQSLLPSNQQGGEDQYRSSLPTLLPLVKDTTAIKDKPSMSIAASAAKEIMEDAAAAAAAVKLAALRRASGDSSVNENDNNNDAYYHHHHQSTNNDTANSPPRAVTIPDIIYSPESQPDDGNGEEKKAKKKVSIGTRTIQFLKAPTTMMRPASFQRFKFNKNNRANSSKSFGCDESVLDTLKSELDYAPPAYNKKKMLDEYSLYNNKKNPYSLAPVKTTNKRILLNGIIIMFVSFLATTFVMFFLYQNNVISVNKSTTATSTNSAAEVAGANIVQTTADGMVAAAMRQSSIGIKDTKIDLRMVDDP